MANEVVLGGMTYEIKPLTLGILRLIGMGAAKQRQGAAKQRLLTDDWAKGEAEWYDGTYSVLANALRMDIKDVEKMENVTLEELAAAVNKIYEITGLAVKKDGKPDAKVGEAVGSVTG